MVGVVFFKISNYNWWYCNRCVFVDRLVCGGFFTLFISYAICAAIVSVGLAVALLCPSFSTLAYVTMFFVSVYFGANCAALLECSGAVLGLLYVVFLLAAEQAANMLCCLLTTCSVCCQRTFREALSDNKLCLGIQICAIFVKLLLIFLFLRNLTALI